MAESADIRDTLQAHGFSRQQANGLSMVLNQLVTREDFSALRQEVADLRTEMHKEIGTLRAEMYQAIGTLREEMHKEIGALRAEVAELRGEMHREIGQIWWKIAMLLIAQAGFIVAMLRLLPA